MSDCLSLKVLRHILSSILRANGPRKCMKGPRKPTVPGPLSTKVLLQYKCMCRSSSEEEAGRGEKNSWKKRILGGYKSSLVLHASVKMLFCKTWEPLNNVQHRRHGQIYLLTQRGQSGRCNSISPWRLLLFFSEAVKNKQKFTELGSRKQGRKCKIAWIFFLFTFLELPGLSWQ